MSARKQKSILCFSRTGSWGGSMADKLKVLPCLFLFLWMSGNQMPARCADFVPLSIEDLGKGSQLVLHGTVVSKSCLRDSAGRIYTRAELEIKEVWKGNYSSNRISLVHSGGTLGDQRAWVSGQVEYQVGEECVVFAVLNPRGDAVAFGMKQGKYGIFKDVTTGKRIAHNGISEARQKLKNVTGQSRLASDNSRSGVEFDELKRRVQAVR